ncbi:BTB/POZ protein [Globomyces pollinis-pini]|nr:BTB/POZ protein [Globomyces pollinis-pini]
MELNVILKFVKFSFQMTNNSEERLTVKLISSDLFEFVIDRKCALASGAIKILLSSPGQFTESVQNEIHFRDIKAVILEKVCKYLYYKVAYSNTMQEVPAFPIEPEIAMELLNAADFLDC